MINGLFGDDKNSEEATKADAAPPRPLKIATIWGISVIWTLVAKIAPITAPTPTPTSIKVKSNSFPGYVKVAIIAINIPNEDNKLPLLAVLGCDNLLIPKIKATAEIK